MNKKQEKQYNKDVEKFIEELREVGVKDDTISKIMEDISEYQQKQYEEMLKDMFIRFKEILKEKLGDYENE